MKEGNRKAWVARELKKIKKDTKSGDFESAYTRTARVARARGDRFYNEGKGIEAGEQYMLAAGAYEAANNPIMESRMYDKMNDALDIDVDRARGEAGILEASFATVLILIGLVLFGSSLTGNVISEMNVLSSQGVIAGIFVFGMVFLLIAVKKRRN